MVLIATIYTIAKQVKRFIFILSPFFKNIKYSAKIIYIKLLNKTINQL